MEPAKNKERVLAALSGGVDSAVAAALLQEAGYDVVAVTLHLWDATGSQQVGRCCAPEDRDDARKVAEHLGIPHYVVDEREAFRKEVVDPFVDAYLRGETPSPCVSCNRTVKVAFLQGLAEQLGAKKIATGHYARLEQEPGPMGDVNGEATPSRVARTRLLRGKDRQKDQSYFLFGVPESVRRRLLFPLGAMEKDEVREHARRFGLPNADKKDSQELCFVPDGNVRGFVAGERGESGAGSIVDAVSHEVVGTHDGISGFTVGQRRGLSLGGGPARYVLRILPETNEVVVGSDDMLRTSEAFIGESTWLHATPTAPFEASVRIRYRHEPAIAKISPEGEGFRVRFQDPQRAVTPGQAAVVYLGDEVLGGGFLQRLAQPGG